MQSKVGDDAPDAAGANGLANLAELLSDDLGGGFRVKKTLADDLADGLIGATVVRLGPGLVVDQGGNAVAGEGIFELEIALLAVAEGRRGGQGPRPRHSPATSMASL